MKTRTISGLVVAGLALVTLFVAAAWPRGVSVQVAPAIEGSIAHYLDEQGMTRLPQTYKVTMPYEARVLPIELEPGSEVAAGQVVARVVPADLESSVAESRAVVERLDASIRENDDTTIERTSEQQSLKFVESMRNTVAAAKTRMESGKAALDYAKSNLERIASLAATGARTQDDKERAQLGFIQGDTDYRQDELIWRSLVAIQAATEMVPEMIRQYISRKDLSRAVLEKQRSEAQERLAQAMLRQTRGTMESPVDGEILQRFVTNEQYLSAGTDLVEIGQLALLEVEADLLTQDAVEVAVGDRVEIYGPAVG
ncbi:MAG: efflux RND transporter periplasmic adaptor subunit, partial [Planctomycetales bacterium]|nr:efflux RND transporter periplasmic adaptor subunit [Planctomycetales bacterium]